MQMTSNGPFQLEFLWFCETYLCGAVPVYWTFVCYSDKNNVKNLWFSTVSKDAIVFF